MAGSFGRVEGSGALQANIRGMAISQMLGAACDVGLPDAIGADEEAEVSALADTLGCHPDALLRLARALAALGLFTVTPQGRVRHTATSLMLRSESAPSQHWAARFWTLPAVWAAWGSLAHSVRTGEPAFRHANGRTFFEHLNEAPADRSLFDGFMQAGFAGRHDAAASALQFADGETVVDVGGGSGALLRAILSRNPRASGLLYDLPSVVAGAPAVLDTADLRERCRVVGGDFFQSVPAGGSTYLLCWVLHDWPDDAAITILRSLRAAMAPGARLVIIDRLLDADPAQCDAYDLLHDINMLVLFQGRERTEAEFNRLMAEAKFSNVAPTLAQPMFSLLETYPE